MRSRAVRMMLTAIIMVALLLGIPGAIVSSVMAWMSENHDLNTRAEYLVNAADKNVKASGDMPQEALDSWVYSPTHVDRRAFVTLKITGKELRFSGEPVLFPVMSASAISPSGTRAEVQISALPAIRRIGGIIFVYLLGLCISLLVGWAIANRLSRRLSAPLIFLAAQAEQIGAGQVHARVKPSGIEEIDLVQEELARTGERMAGRLAAERQFAADASHQLRTPLTALSMRLEEIELVTSEEEVRLEARKSLEQIERLTHVIDDLIKNRAWGGGQTEAIHILPTFNSIREAWEEDFARVDRELIFTDKDVPPVLADGTKLSQVIAILLENSLRYGAGKTKVIARQSSERRGVIIEITDEGEGIDADLAPNIFEKGISGHGSSGIGLYLARDLTQAMGGKLELMQLSPPLFAISLSALPHVPASDQVILEGPIVSIGHRNRHF